MPSEKYITHEKRTKRGNKYNTRKTKLATGFSKVLADRRTKTGTWDDPKTNELRKLALFGTLDPLGKSSWGSAYKTITKKHPVDPDYTKQVRVLSDLGKKRLKELRQKKSAQL